MNLQPDFMGISRANIWVCLKMLCTPKPNGFANHYPYEKWLFHWEYTQHFQTNPYICGFQRRVRNFDVFFFSGRNACVFSVGFAVI